MLVDHRFSQVHLLKMVLFGMLIILTVSSCDKDYFNWTLPVKVELEASIIEISADMIQIKGEILNDNIGEIEEVGFLITKGNDFTLAEKYILDKNNNNVYVFNFIEFDYSTYYEVVFYLLTSAGESKSSVVGFSTPNIPGAPTVLLNGFSDVSLDNVNVAATVTLEGAFPVVSRGFCWSTTPNPTINNSSSLNGSGVGSYSNTITNLDIETTYFIRAYATNQIATSYSNQMEIKTKSIEELSFGDFFQGGLLFYIFQVGDLGYVQGQTHGLIAATEDQGSFTWGCNGTNVSTSDAIGAGLNNTSTIVSNCNQTNIAARICSNLAINGFNDWFLPSSNELMLIRQNLHQNNLGSFQNAMYWSSHQFSASTAAAINFNLGGTALNNVSKEISHQVRAIRKF